MNPFNLQYNKKKISQRHDRKHHKPGDYLRSRNDIR